jgi:hypothetical protein
MTTPNMPNSRWGSLTFNDLITQYTKIQNDLKDQITAIAQNSSTATPGRFLLLQFQMSQVTQIGDSISNLVSQVQSMINNAIRNQKTS